MRTSKELTELFIADLKRYNSTNFKTIVKADLSKQDATVHKAFSSVVTRYFIFREKHPEVSDVEHRMLYFKLTIDKVASYFAEFPDTTTDNLVGFQLELKKYVKEHRNDKKEEDDPNVKDSSVSDIGLEPDNGLPVEQQQESVPHAV